MKVFYPLDMATTWLCNYGFFQAGSLCWKDIPEWYQF